MFLTTKEAIETIKKDTKIFQDVSEILQELIAERKAETARYEKIIEELQKEIDSLRPKFTVVKGRGVVKCVFENMSPEERMKPLGLVCYCQRCSPYSM